LKIVVGLGNPGREYADTRHNVGFRVVDELARRGGATLRSSGRANARCARMRIEGAGEALLAQPQTYMNGSGDAVAPLMQKHGAGPADLVVVVDDADLPAGRLRVRAGGRAGGHNGLKSIIERIGSDAFARVRVGVGRSGGELRDHVLSRFAPDERARMDEAVAAAADAVWCLLTEGAERAMNRFNAAPEDAERKTEDGKRKTEDGKPKS
jgi:PTH1 family peptidyl-tRNA hydrolase